MFKSKIVGVVVQIQDNRKRVIGESIIPVDENAVNGDKPFRKDVVDLGKVPETDKYSYKRNDIRQQDLAAMRKKGMNNKEIAEHYGCSVSTVVNHTNGKSGKIALPKKTRKSRKPFDLSEVSKMVSLYKQGLSVSKIAKQFKSVESTIYRRFNQVAEKDEVLRKKLLNRGK